METSLRAVSHINVGAGTAMPVREAAKQHQFDRMHRCSRCTRLMCHCEERSDAAISGRHWHPTPATMKTVCTDCVCSGGQRPPLAVTGFCAPSPTVQCPQICHCEAPTGPWQSREGSCVFAAAYQLSTIVLRDSHVASLLGMTRQGSVRCTSALTRLNRPVHGGH